MRSRETWKDELRATLRSVWSDALERTTPGPLVREALAMLPDAMAGRPRYVVAVGKAAYSMLEGVAAAGGWVDAVGVGPAPQRAKFLRSWGGAAREVEGDGAYVAVAEVHTRGRCGPLLARVGTHPVPDLSSVEAAERLQAFVMQIPAEALLVALVSGGASAMVAKPRAGLTLDEKVAATSRRMAEGAAIAELNALRRSLSAVKGGQLIEGVAAPVVSLLLSDVEGDDPGVVASGLTISKQASPLELKEHGDAMESGSGLRTLWTGFGPDADAEGPPAVRGDERKEAEAVVSAGEGSENRTLEPGRDRGADTSRWSGALTVGEREGASFRGAGEREASLVAALPVCASMPRDEDRYVILAGQDAVARAAADALRSRGWAVTLREEGLVGTVEEAARDLVAALGGADGHPSPKRRAIVAYGEPVVVIPERAGTGGRAQQLALLLAREMAELPVVMLVAGTDGIDGPSIPPVAGAIVDGGTWAAMRDARVDGARALSRCDARTVLDAVGQLLVTGPTGINHSDVMILLWDPEEGGDA